MKTLRSIVVAAVAILVFATPASAQQRKKDGKTTGEKAVEAAGNLLDALIGGGGERKAPARGGAKGKPGAPRVDEGILADQAQMFAGVYGGDNGVDSVIIQPVGAGCLVQMKDARGTYAGLGFSVDGFFAASFDPGRQGGVMVYRIDGGKLSGTGIGYSGKSIGVIAENLEGSKKLLGEFKITSAAGVDGNGYSGSCTIKLAAENSYQLTWEVAGDKFYGVGFVMGPEMWVAWSPKKDAFLTVFERDGGNPGTLNRHALFNLGKPPGDLAPVRLRQGAAPAAPVALVRPVVPGVAVLPVAPVAPKRDRFGNVILPPPAGLEKPIDVAPGAAGAPMVGVAPGARRGVQAAPAGVPPAGGPFPVLAPGQTAADLAEKKSQDQGGDQVVLTVTNGTAAPIRVNWLDQDGNEGRSDDTIAAGDRVEMGSTGLGHFFRARQAQSNALLQEFRIKNQGAGRFDITITGPVVAAGPGGRAAGGRPAPVPPAPAPAGGAAVDQAGIAAFMKIHNDARAEVGVAPLQWDPKLAAFAQEWANDLAARDGFDHRPNSGYGENIAGFIPAQGEGPANGAKMWYDEKPNYRPGSKVGDPQAGEVGHYTQMVWRKSTRVGFGVAVNSQGMAILVANYDPPGNFPEKPY